MSDIYNSVDQFLGGIYNLAHVFGEYGKILIHDNISHKVNTTIEYSITDNTIISHDSVEFTLKTNQAILKITCSIDAARAFCVDTVLSPDMPMNLAQQNSYRQSRSFKSYYDMSAHVIDSMMTLLASQRGAHIQSYFLSKRICEIFIRILENRRATWANERRLSEIPERWYYGFSSESKNILYWYRNYIEYVDNSDVTIAEKG